MEEALLKKMSTHIDLNCWCNNYISATGGKQTQQIRQSEPTFPAVPASVPLWLGLQSLTI